MLALNNIGRLWLHMPGYVSLCHVLHMCTQLVLFEGKTTRYRQWTTPEEQNLT